MAQIRVEIPYEYEAWRRELAVIVKDEPGSSAVRDLAVERRNRIERLLGDRYALGVGPDIADASIMRRARR